MNPNNSMYGLLADAAHNAPEDAACTFFGKKLIFRQLLGAVDRLAGELSARGVGVGSVVTICLPNTPHAVIAFYAVNKLGAIADMVHPQTPAAQLKRYMKETKADWLFLLDLLYAPKAEELRSTGVNIVLCSVADYLGWVRGTAFRYQNKKGYDTLDRTGTLTWSDLLRSDKNVAERVSDPSLCAAYLHSGGTTGSPKTIQLSSRAFNELAVLGPYMVNTENVKGKKMLAILPLFHGFGLCMCMHAMLSNQATCILIPRFDIKALVRIIKKERPNYLTGVPTLYESMLRSPQFRSLNLSCIEAVFCGGDALPMALKGRFDDLLAQQGSSTQMFEGYGLTETVTVCCVNTADENRSGSVGKPLPGTQMMVESVSSGQPLPSGEDGEICVTCPAMMSGYLEDPEGTAQAIRLHDDGLLWVHTGDFGCIDKDGFVWFKQRIKRIIKSSGVAVFPSEIEDCICSISEVESCCVIGIPDEKRYQRVKAYIVLHGGLQPSEAIQKKILLACEQNLIRWAIPSELEFRTALPQTMVGKVDYLALEREQAGK